jgi:hypothetical protein
MGLTDAAPVRPEDHADQEGPFSTLLIIVSGSIHPKATHSAMRPAVFVRLLPVMLR